MIKHPLYILIREKAHIHSILATNPHDLRTICSYDVMEAQWPCLIA